MTNETAAPAGAAELSAGNPAGRELSPAITLLFAIACGLSVANIYFAQPLLDAMAHDFGIDPAAIGIVVTLTQAGYAVGLMLIVPLGDLWDRRRLIVGQTMLSAIALVVVGTASNAAMLLGGNGAGRISGRRRAGARRLCRDAGCARRARTRHRHRHQRGGVGHPARPFRLRYARRYRRLAHGLSGVGRAHAGDGRAARARSAPTAARGHRRVILCAVAALDRGPVRAGADPARTRAVRAVDLRQSQRVLDLGRAAAVSAAVVAFAHHDRVARDRWRRRCAGRTQRRPARRSRLGPAHHRIVADADARRLGSNRLPAHLRSGCSSPACSCSISRCRRCM